MKSHKGWRVIVDYCRHGYRPKPDDQRHKDEKRNEDFWFYPKYKATK